MLWVVAWGIFQENLHLYYRMRASYGDHRFVHEAPGHLFLDYETAELASFLQMGIDNGWDMFLFGWEDHGRLFASHDEYFIATFRYKEEFDEFDSYNASEA